MQIVCRCTLHPHVRIRHARSYTYPSLYAWDWPDDDAHKLLKQRRRECRLQQVGSWLVRGGDGSRRWAAGRLPDEAVWPGLRCLSQGGRAGIMPGMIPARLSGALGAVASRRYCGEGMGARCAAGVMLARRPGGVFAPAGPAGGQGSGWAAGPPLPLGRAGSIGSRNGGDDRLPVKGMAW